MNRVFIGAPRAQSTFELQRSINETGAIYKCTFEKPMAEICAPFVFDSIGNDHEDNNEFTFNKEMKDFQWLGASMDGTSSDTDKFVVCLIAMTILSIKQKNKPHNYISGMRTTHHVGPNQT